MEIPRITLPPIAGPGAVTTFYAYDSGAARSLALAGMAHLLAGRRDGTVPVLMIDWDLDAPGLHHQFGAAGQRPGLLEYMQACRDQLHLLARASIARDPEALAHLVLESVDWEQYVERVDPSRPLYLMRAGCFDDSYGERASRFDWDGLFKLCPALYRQFAAQMTARFAHVFIDARCGRSAAVSVCTALLPTRLVGLFTPSLRSLDGLAGVLGRAVEYRCTHEDEQRPLLLYPVPCAVDAGDCARRLHWRRGAPGAPCGPHASGYQGVLEQLMRACYGLGQLSLDSYFDEVALQQTCAMAVGEAPGAAPERDPDRFSLTRTFDTLLDWVAAGRFPWQSHAEVLLLERIDAARAQPASGLPGALALAAGLDALASLCLAQDRLHEAHAALAESVDLNEGLLGAEHALVRAGRARLASLLARQGQHQQARAAYEALLALSVRAAGDSAPETLALRGALAATLGQLQEYGRALALHHAVVEAYEQQCGPGHPATLAALMDQASTLARNGERSRARMVIERVLDERERALGPAHPHTLDCMTRLAALLADMGDLSHARPLQEQVLAAHSRHAGPVHALTLAAHEALADTVAAQGDLGAVRTLFDALMQARARRFGPDHPVTLSTELRLAAALGGQGALAPAPASGATPPLPPLSAGPHDLADPAPARPAAPPDALEHQLTELQHLLDRQDLRAARVLADTVRKAILRPSVALARRRRGAALIKQVYRLDQDTEALLAFTQDEVAALEGALDQAGGAHPLAVP